MNTASIEAKVFQIECDTMHVLIAKEYSRFGIIKPLNNIIDNTHTLQAVTDATIVLKTAATKRNRDMEVKWTAKNNIIWRKNLGKIWNNGYN